MITLFFISVQEMGNVPKLLGCVLERLNLLPQLRLLGLLLTEHFMNVSHGCGPPEGTLSRRSASVNPRGYAPGYAGNLLPSKQVPTIICTNFCTSR